MIRLIEKIYAIDAKQLGGAIKIDETTGTIEVLITRIVSWILYIAGALAFIYLVVSGISYITAGGNAEQAKKGQQGIINAVIGIIIVTLSFVILQATVGIASKDAPAPDPNAYYSEIFLA